MPGMALKTIHFIKNKSLLSPVNCLKSFPESENLKIFAAILIVFFLSMTLSKTINFIYLNAGFLSAFIAIVPTILAIMYFAMHKMRESREEQKKNLL